jgi:hypothetical protein
MSVAPALIVDLGAAFTKVGFAGNLNPCLCCPTVVREFGDDAAAADADADADARVYRRATALEALVGHLQLSDPDRLLPLMGVALAAAERAAEGVAAAGEGEARASAALGAAGRRRDK